MKGRPSSSGRLALCLCSLLISRPAGADVSLLVNEAIGSAAEVHGGGHAAVYLSNICSDDLVTVRLCAPGEHGVVVSTYPNLVLRKAPYWMAVPLATYLYGVDDVVEAPMFGNQAILDLLRQRFARAHLGPWNEDGNALPRGEWPSLVGNVFKRTVYAFHLTTTAEQDARAIEVLASVQQRRRFDLSYNNCSDFARVILNTYFPGAVHRDVLNDFTLTTPKAVARTLTAFAKRQGGLGFEVIRYRQLDGPIARSLPNRNLTEKAVTSKKYLAVALVNPFVPVVLGGLYLVSGRFSIEGAFEESTTSSHLQAGRLSAPARVAGGSRASLTTGIDVTGSTAWGWRQYRQTFDRLVSEAVERRLFGDRSAVKNFLSGLESVSTPESEDVGGLRLRVGSGDDVRSITPTRTGLTAPASDPRLAYMTMMSIVARSWEGSGHRPTLDEAAADWHLLEALRDRDGVWTTTGPTVCATKNSCRPVARPVFWKRALTFLTR